MPPNRQVGIIVSSDRAHSGTYDDLSGPAARDWLGKAGFDVLDLMVLPDEPQELLDALDGFQSRGAAMVIVSGGTGLSPRDKTPQTVDKFSDYQIPGFGELMRQGSMKFSLNAYLSRCGGWVKDRMLILALPGNPKAVCEQLDILADLLPHALKSLHGECVHRRRNADVQHA